MADPNRILADDNTSLVVTNIGDTGMDQSTFGGLPLGTVGDSATGELGVKVVLVGTGTSAASVGITTFKGAANIASGQVALSGTAGTLIAARATRRSVTIKNLDASITIYVGPATVTTANGMQLKAGESISIDWVGLIQGIAASGTPTAAYMETYD